MKVPAIVVAAVVGLVAGSALVSAQDDKKKADAAPKAKDAPKADAAGALPKDVVAKASYYVGRTVGAERRRQCQALELDPEAMAKGFASAVKGDKSEFTDEELEAAVTAFQAELSKRQRAEMKKRQADMAANAPPETKKAAEANKKEADDFLAKNKTKAGVKTTESGLQYEVLKEGKGTPPTPNSTVRVHYVGTLLDGTEFDSSIRRGQPAEFQVGGVIPGWTEALQLMKPNAKYKLYIPPDLAYGFSGSPPKIGPNKLLVFEVELLGVE